MDQEVAEVISGSRAWTVVRADCLEVLRTLPAGSVDAVVTDPPFGIGFRSNYRIERHGAIGGDGDDSLLKWACDIPVVHSRYVFCRWDNLRDIPKPRSLITWVKNNWSMGDLEHEHARQTEVIAFWPGPNHNWPSHRPTDVVFHPRSGNELHPTEKTVSLMREVVSWTPEGCTVCDPFCGVGSTGVACMQLGRRFIGVELSEAYADIARRRIAEAANTLWTPTPKQEQQEIFKP